MLWGPCHARGLRFWGTGVFVGSVGGVMWVACVRGLKVVVITALLTVILPVSMLAACTSGQCTAVDAYRGEARLV